MSLPGGYVNLLDEADQKRLLLAFARNYKRLLALKRTYDPDDVFHSTIGHITPTEKDSISLFQPAREMGQVIK